MKGWKFQCVKEQAGLSDQIKACMEKQGSESPQAMALKNSKEVDDKGVSKADNAEPFFFYNGVNILKVLLTTTSSLTVEYCKCW